MNDLKLSWGSRAKCSVAIIGMILVCASGSLLAQHAPDAIAENFYPPELIRQAHQAIGLTAEQEDALKSTFQKAQERITDLQQRWAHRHYQWGRLYRQAGSAGSHAPHPAPPQ